MKNIKLQTAIMLAFNELLALGGFSAYEVTTLIRQRVDKDYTLSDVDQDVLHAVPFTEIVHSDVRDIVNELFDNGLFEATKSYEMSGGKGYTGYNALPNTNTSAMLTQLAPITQTSPTPATDHCLNKIDNYLKNNGCATIKQIQSALKVKGLTCKDIATILGVHAGSPRVMTFDINLSKVVVAA